MAQATTEQHHLSGDHPSRQRSKLALDLSQDAAVDSPIQDLPAGLGPESASPPIRPPTTPFKEVTKSVKFADKARSIKGLIFLFLVNLIFAVLYCLFVYYVLIQGIVQVGPVFFDASTTNLIVSIFSQLWAILCDTNVRALLAALRSVLAMRTRGSPIATYFSLGASDWLSVCKIAIVNRLLNLWCNLRLGIPIMGLAFGSILKYQAEFQFQFVPGNTTIPVYAGLIPVDLRVLDLIPASDIAMYHTMWSSSLLTHPRFAIASPFDGCDEHCRSILLPGGVELLRQVGPSLNKSVLGGGVLDAAQTIRVDNASGIMLKFEDVGNDFAFDHDRDCIVTGQQVNNGLQVCLQQAGDSIAVGWTACPLKVFNAEACYTNLTWATDPMKWTTKMTAFYQRTTTSYDRQNFSVVDLQATSAPQPLPLSAANYTSILRRALVPTDLSTPADVANINALIYSITWMHRLYGNSFPDDHNSIESNLQNFLAIPVQFAVTALQFANYSVATKSPAAQQLLDGSFALPDDMIATATGGASRDRLVILVWTGWLFIAGVVVVQAAILGGILWVLAQSRSLSGTTGLLEFDILREADELACFRARRTAARLRDREARRRAAADETITDETITNETISLAELAKDADIPESVCSWRLARMLRGWRVTLAGGNRLAGGTETVYPDRASAGSVQTLRVEEAKRRVKTTIVKRDRMTED